MKLTSQQQRVIESVDFQFSPDKFRNYLNEEQIANLRKLAEYLVSKRNKRAEFDMKYYTELRNVDAADTTTECGSVGCAVGHGPYAGIPKYQDENWLQYAKRSFYNGIGDMFDYLFSDDWAENWLDNTALGAGKRILFMLKFGLPHDNQCLAYKKFSVKQLR